MLFDITAVVDGDEIKVRSSARDILDWESEHDESFISSETTMSKLLQLAYLAAKRTKATTLSFDQFVDGLEDFKTAQVKVDPTRKGRSGKRSAKSS